MRIFKTYYLMLLCTVLIFADEDHIIYYSLEQGPNLFSFPILTDNNDIESFFTSENSNLFSNTNLELNILSIISEGEFTFINESNWNGSLDQINQDKGYWIIAQEPATFLYLGNTLNNNLYFHLAHFQLYLCFG